MPTGSVPTPRRRRPPGHWRRSRNATRSGTTTRAGTTRTTRRTDRVTAYWISTYDEILDEAKVAAYAELAGPALRAGGGTFIARGLPEQVYEAGSSTRTVLIE